jgi:hypothetical protein
MTLAESASSISRSAWAAARASATANVALDVITTTVAARMIVKEASP